MAHHPRQAKPPSKPDLQALLAQAGKEPKSELAKLCIHTLYTELRDDVLRACIAALEDYKVPQGRKLAEDLRSDLFASLHDTAPRFKPNEALVDKEARRWVLAFITRPAWWIAADESADVAESLAYEMEVGGALAAYCRVGAGLTQWTINEEQASTVAAACEGADEYLSLLKPKHRKILVIYSNHLERVRVKRQAEHHEDESMLHTERAPPTQVSWEWRIPDGDWKKIGKELKMKPDTARKAVQRAMERLEKACRQATPKWFKASRRSDQ